MKRNPGKLFIVNCERREWRKDLQLFTQFFHQRFRLFVGFVQVVYTCILQVGFKEIQIFCIRIFV